MQFTHEDVRAAVLELIAEPNTDDYNSLPGRVATLLHQKGFAVDKNKYQCPALRPDGQTMVAEVFWELFRQGIVTLGATLRGPDFPFFHVSEFGRKLLQNHDSYLFPDASSYEKKIRAAVPGIHLTTLLYLKEAMQAFKVGCILSSTVMLGVAAEHTFDLLMATIDGSPAHSKTYTAVKSERLLQRRINKFRECLERSYQGASSGLAGGSRYPFLWHSLPDTPIAKRCWSSNRKVHRPRSSILTLRVVSSLL